MTLLSFVILSLMTLTVSQADMDYSCQPGMKANSGGNYMTNDHHIEYLIPLFS